LELRQAGFSAHLSDRTGATLSSGGDTEICRALRLANWKLFYDPRLRLQHFMPASRLQWDYLRRLRRSLGASSAGLDPYAFATRRNRLGVSKVVRENWLFQSVVALRDLAGYGMMAIRSERRALEGSEKALEVEFLLGRLGALWQSRGDYGRRIREVRKAPWRKVQCAPALPVP
jgi:hypothetical protein